MKDSTGLSAALVAAVGLAGLQAQAYDIHTKALTPIQERPAPAGEAMAFVENGALRFAIVTDNEARDAKAVALLREVFEKTAGKAPSVATPAAAATNGLPYRILLAPDTSLPKEGFCIKTSPEGLAISGHTYFGALDFAERFLGVRWYFPGEYGSIYPPCHNLSIAPVWYEDAPCFQSRGGRFYVWTSVQDEAQTKRWAPYMGEVGLRDASFVERWRDGGTLPGGGAHNPRPDRMAKSHPDKIETIFYRSPQGKLWYNPKAHIGNVFNVLDLGLADMLVDDWKHYLASGRKAEADRGGFGDQVNDTFVSFGICDTYLPLGEVASHPVVKELGLITQADIDRAPDAAMANVYGRFYQYLGRKVEAEFPGKRLFLLIYYNSMYASLDPRWKLPGNIEVNVCDGRLPLRTRSPKHMEKSRRLFREWYDATGGRPVLKAWLYASRGDKFKRALGPEFIGDVPKVLGEYLGRGLLFYDFDGGRDLWHYFYSAYVGWRSQWNPDLDVDAAIDEMWRLCLGPVAGAKMSDFHRELKAAYLKYAVEDDAASPTYPASVIDRLEALLRETEALLAPDSVEMRRFKLVADFWPEAFAAQRAQASYEPPVYDVHRLLPGEAPKLDGVPDEAFWANVPAVPLMDKFSGEPGQAGGSLKLAWDGQGLYAAFSTDAGAPKTGGDLWANDTLEFFISRGLGKEVLHQLAFDADGAEYSSQHRLLPIPQPIDRQWTARGRVYKASMTAGGWTAELFIPFSAIEGGPPKVYDNWNFNFVHTRRDRTPNVIASSSLTGIAHNNLAMYGMLRFVGKGD